jgi:3-phenylpropionate/cinnamic acid dioxygenase small subunit
MGPAAAPGLDVPTALRQRVGDLYCAYCDALDDGDYERWPDFFPETCLYKVLPRENFARNLPIGLIACESRAMLRDRVTALRETALYAPRIVRHFVSSLRVRAIEPDGIRATANFLLIQSELDQPSETFLAGTYHDRIVETEGGLRFAEKLCVYDSTIVPTSLVFPV